MVGVSSHPGHRPRDDGALCHRRDLRLGGTADHAEDRPARHQHRRASPSCSCRCWSPPGALYTGHIAILPFAAAAMLWGHYWDASNCMTIPTVVARPEYRGTASGFAYMFVKLPSFLAIFLFPVAVRSDRSSQRDAVRRDLPADRIAGGDLHPAGSLRLRAGVSVVRPAPHIEGRAAAACQAPCSTFWQASPRTRRWMLSAMAC